MKFSRNNITKKQVSSQLIVDEYSTSFSDFSMDGAIAYLNGSYGPKINKKLTELLFVLKGELIIHIDNQEYIILPEDLFIILPDKPHTLVGNDAKIFIVCSPPFNPDNILYR